MKGFIFMNRFGNVHNPQAVNRAIKRIYEAYNAEEVVKAAREHREPLLISHFSCHHLRHTFWSRFCENETNLRDDAGKRRAGTSKKVLLQIEFE